MKKVKTVAIEITPSRVDIAALDGGKISLTERIPANLSADPAEWVQGLRRLGEQAHQAVERLGCLGAKAVVLYRSPTLAIDLSSFDVKAASDALEAGRLSCCDSLPYSGLATVSDSIALGRDISGDARQVHVLASAERDDVATSIVEFIERAGLQYGSATPIDACIMSMVASSTFARKREHCGILYIGEHSSFFVVGGAGRMSFNRRIGLGMESIAQALTRPIRQSQGDPVELSIDEARELVVTHGVGDREAVVHEGHGLTGWQILPLVQPILQRSVVELRQSVRFGIADEDKEGFHVVAIGPGAQVPGLTQLIGTELGVEIKVRECDNKFDWSVTGGEGSELADAIRDRSLLDRLNLQPIELARTRRLGMMRRWLITGTAAALAVVGFDAFRFGAQASDLRREAEMLEMQTADLEAMHTTAERLSASLVAMGQLENMIRTEVGSTVSYPACMKELSRLTPESIRFTVVSLARSDGIEEGMLEGFVSEADDRILADFVGQLRESPLISDVVLGNVQMGRLGEDAGSRFTISFRAVMAPREIAGVTDVPEEVGQ